MRRWIPRCTIWVSALFALSGEGLARHQEADKVKVRVRLAKTHRPIEISGLGLAFGPRGLRPVASLDLERYQIRYHRSGTVKPHWEIFDRNRSSRRKIDSLDLAISGESLNLGLRPIPQNIKLKPRNEGVDVIAEVDLETYLAGVLPAEMPASWPIEALKAQAVASRSYAMALLRERGGQRFDLEDTIMDQVFRPESFKGLSEEHRRKVLKALTETQGEILVNARGFAVKAFYHSDCGGRTELARHVWGGSLKDKVTEAKLSGESSMVSDSSCPRGELARWEYRMPRSKLMEVLRDRWGEVAREIKGMVIGARTPSGRVSEVVILVKGDLPRRLSGQALRGLIGFGKLRSTFFHIQWLGDEIVFTGRGFGHGVGLCQSGAKQLAQEGKSYLEILSHYFRDIEIRSPSTLRVSL